MAGPAMNLLLAIGLVALEHGLEMFHAPSFAPLCQQAAGLSLVLCFFNLIPVPPLDGSHVLRVITNMSFEAYMRFAQFGFVIIIVLLQLRVVRELLSTVTFGTLFLLERVFGLFGA